MSRAGDVFIHWFKKPCTSFPSRCGAEIHLTIVLVGGKNMSVEGTLKKWMQCLRLTPRIHIKNHQLVIPGVAWSGQVMANTQRVVVTFYAATDKDKRRFNDSIRDPNTLERTFCILCFNICEELTLKDVVRKVCPNTNTLYWLRLNLTVFSGKLQPIMTRPPGRLFSSATTLIQHYNCQILTPATRILPLCLARNAFIVPGVSELRLISNVRKRM